MGGGRDEAYECRTALHGSHQQLAEEMGDLYYDSLADLLRNLGEKLERDAASDCQRGRMKLSKELAAAADHLSGAADSHGCDEDFNPLRQKLR